MTDDITEMQTDSVNACGIPQGDGPARKWFYQRIMAMMAFACVLWWPLVVWATDSDKVANMTTEWFAFHGAIVLYWYGGSTLAARRS